MQLLPEIPIGRPSFDLNEDQVATAIDLICRASIEARQSTTPGMSETKISILIRKAMRRLKKQAGLTNLEIAGETEILDPDDNTTQEVGRIDIIFRFVHQFGDEEAYLAVECKRLEQGNANLNNRYVVDGFSRFATGQYSKGHRLGMMLGYVLKIPVDAIAHYINGRVVQIYTDEATLTEIEPHQNALLVMSGKLAQGQDGHQIQVLHIFVDMLPAAAQQTH